MVAHLLKLGDIDFSSLTMSRDLRKNSWIKLYTRKLENLFVQKWNEERNKILRDRKSKLELYSSIKANYGFEKYIGFINDTQSRKLLTQLRVSAHKFPIEKERYENIPRGKRTCKICKSDLIGDQFHYLFECHCITLTQRRTLFINNLLNTNPNFSVFDLKSLFHYVVSLKDVYIIEPREHEGTERDTEGVACDMS